MRNSLSHGFTLVELLVSLAVLAVVMGLAVPSIRDYLLNQRVRSVAFDLAASLLQTRSEAGKRSANVTITQAAGGWQNGWTITLDDGTVITQHEAAADISVVANYNAVVYQDTGRVVMVGAVAPTFTIGPADVSYLGSVQPRCVAVTSSGKVTNQC